MNHSAPLLEEHRDRWLVAQTGGDVIRLVFDYAVTLMVDTGSGVIELRIGGPFVITGPSGHENLLIPEGEPEQRGPALALARQRVDQILAFKDGHLEVEFADGTRLGVPSEEGLEAWELSGPSGLRVLALPGGQVAVWLPRT
jgi:Family of unknown function (DUF6188)